MAMEQQSTHQSSLPPRWVVLLTGWVVLAGLALLLAAGAVIRFKPGLAIFYNEVPLGTEQLLLENESLYRMPVSEPIPGGLEDARAVFFLDGRSLVRVNNTTDLTAAPDRFLLEDLEDGSNWIYFSSQAQLSPAAAGQRVQLLLRNPSVWVAEEMGLIYLLLGGFLAFQLAIFILRSAAARTKLRQSLFAAPEVVGGRLIALLPRSLREISADQAYRLFCVLTGAVLMVIALVRAASVSMTWDEARTINQYTRYIFDFLKIDVANNHMLNTFLIYLNGQIWGVDYNEFIIRLPSLLFYVLYLIMAYQTGNLFRWRYLVFSLLVFNPYLSEFFSLARGYGMAAALLLTGLYVYLRKRGDWSAIIVTIYLFLLGASANYILLVFLSCFGLYVVFMDIGWKNLSRFILWGFPHLIPQFAMFGGLLYAFLQVTGEGRNAFGSDGSFFQAVLVGFGDTLFIFPALAFSFAILLIATALGVLAMRRQRVLDQPVSVMLMGFLLLTAISAQVSGRPLPTGRLLIPFWPALILFFVETLGHFPMPAGRLQKAWSGGVVPAVICGILALNGIFSIHLHDTIPWEGNVQYRNMVYVSAIKGKTFRNDELTPILRFYLSKINYDFGVDLFRK